jgi:regulator of protease activity HflC (stomatin/prohibitin superfamily)
MILDDVFERKDTIANAVSKELNQTMLEFGYEIVKALVTNIELEEKVKNAMNEINEQQRLQVAAQAKGEAEKILLVKRAEAEAESKKLQGEGIANQRKAIIDGLRKSVEDFQKTVSDVSASEIMTLVLVTQYFDTLKEIGANNKSSTILLPHSPVGIKDLAAQMQEGIITGNLASKNKE